MNCMQEDPVSVFMIKFKRSSSHTYSLITPSTPLGELEAFLQDNIFALGIAIFVFMSLVGTSPSLSSSVTDHDRKFVLALATLSDLEVSPGHLLL